MTTTESPRTGYRPAVDYLVESLQGQGTAIAKHVAENLSSDKTFELASAIRRATAKAVRVRLAVVAEDVLAMQVEPDCEADR